MATELEINAKINTANSAEGLANIRKSLKELVSLQGQVGSGSKEFAKLRDAINQTEGKLSDLNDSFATLRGSGVERLESSVGLLKEGFNSFDTEKIKIGFQGLGSAMSAIPIFLLVEGLKLLVENAKELYEWFTEITDTGKSLESQLKAIHKENELLNATYQNQITALEGIKGNEEEIYKIKQKQLALSKEESKIALAIAIEKERQASGEYTWKQRLLQAVGAGAVAELDKAKQIKEAHHERLKAENDVGKAIADGIKLENERDQKAIDNYKKLAEERKKNREETSNAFKESLQGELDDSKIHFDDLTKQISDNYVKQNELQDEQLTKAREKKEAADKKELEDAIRLAALINNAKFEAASKTVDTAKNMAGALLAIETEKFNQDRDRIKTLLNDDRLSKEEKLALELELFNKENALKKKQFQVDKAENISRAIIDGVRSVQAALTIPPPVGTFLAIAAGTAAAANVAKIAATKFDGGTAPSLNPGGGGSSGGGSIGSGAQTQAPQQQTLNNNSQLFSGTVPGTNQTGSSTKQNITKVVVLQKDIKEAMDKVQVINDQAKF